MSARLRVASCLLLAALFASAVYFLPQRLFGKVSLLELDSNEPNMALSPGRQILGLRLEYGKKLNVAITRMAPHTEYEARLSYPASYPAECTVDVRTGASSFDDSIGGSGRELLNTEKRMFNSGSESEGIVEISCDTIAVVSFSSSSPPPNHVIFNIGAALCGSSLMCTVTLSNCSCSTCRNFMSAYDFCQAALADMVGPIPKDSYALILFAAICVFTSAFAAVYYLPAIAWFFAHISAESKS